MFLNIGTGIDQTINEIAIIIKKIVGFEGEIRFDNTHPDGTYKKLLDISQLKSIGSIHQYKLEDGIKMIYHKYNEH